MVPESPKEEEPASNSWPVEITETRWLTSSGESHKSYASAVIGQARHDARTIFANLAIPWSVSSSERDSRGNWIGNKGQRFATSIVNQLPSWYMIFRQVAADINARDDVRSRAQNAVDWLEREVKNKGY